MGIKWAFFFYRSSKQEGFMGLGRFDGNGSNLDAASGFQSISVFDHSSDDDLFSTTSWEGGEDEEEEETDLDSESDGEDEESKFQATPLPQKKMKKPSRASTTSTLPENEEAPVEVKKVEVVKEENDHLPKATPRPTAQPTIYQKLTKANVDWCRYCGTTEGVNWRPGPWGKRTLCK